MEKNCEFKNRIVDYVDGTLEGDAAREYEEHIKVCDECREEYEEYLEMLRVFNSCQMEIPPDVHEKVMRRIRREILRKAMMKAVKRYAVPVAAALVLALTVPAVLRAGDATNGAPHDTEPLAAYGIPTPTANDDGGKKDRSGVNTEAAEDRLPEATAAATDALPDIIEAPTAEDASQAVPRYQYSVTETFNGEELAVCYLCPIIEVEKARLGELRSKLGAYIRQDDGAGVVFEVSEAVISELKALGCDVSDAKKADFVRVNSK